ncbi:MAG: hypothetical protein JXP34_11945 [Planctomycetes bacterium]|nr:hypothetical protein [Planctomycetota bacterium]
MQDRTMLAAALAWMVIIWGICGVWGIWGGQPCLGEEIPALRVVQRIEGFPGLEQDRPTTVVLVIARDRLVASRDFDGTVFIVRLDIDKGRMYEIAPNRKHYREWIEFQDLQKERDVFERQLISLLKEELKGDEYERALAKHHLNPDGTRKAAVEEPKAEREIELGGTTHRARQVIVTENGRRIIDAWYAPLPADATDLAGQIEFYEFYRRLGCFSDAVLDVLKGYTTDHRGIPLEARIRVVTATLNYDLKARTIEFSKTTVPATLFEVPSGAEKVDPEKAIVKCAWPACQEQVEIAAPPYKWRDRSGRWYYFCCREHKERFVRERRERIEKQAAGGADTGK